MKMKTKLLALALCLCFALMSVPVGGFAAGNEAKVIKPNGDSLEYATLREALSAAASGETVKLLKDATVPGDAAANPPTGRLLLKAGVMLDGDSHKITATGNWPTDNSSKQFLMFGGNDCILKDIILDCAGIACGVTAYGPKTGIMLMNVQILETKTTGLTVSGATVYAFNLTASQKGNYAVVDMEPNGGPTSTFKLYGSKNDLGTKNPIQCDSWNRNKDKVTVEARNYDPTDSGSYKHTWKLGSPKREYITYFNVDEKGKVVGADGNSTTIFPAKEQQVGNENKHGQTYSVTLEPPTLTREGYILEGWTTNPDGTGTLYQANETIYGNHNKDTNDKWDDDLILYAKWKKAKYTVTFDGGKIDGVPISGHTTQPAGKWTDLNPGEITLPENPYTADGYAFTGWKCSADNAIYQPDSSYNVTEDVTFTAQWKKTYTVTFDMNLNDGTASQPSPESIAPVQVAYNGVLTINNPARNGYTFNGWGTSPNAPMKYPVTEGVNTISYTHVIDDDITLYANWTLLSYTITYNLDGGSNPLNPTTYTVEDAITLRNPTKAGCAFLGWTKDGDPNQTPQTEMTITAGTTGNIAFTAHWEENAAPGGTYTVTFKIQNGVWADGTAGQITVTVTNGMLDFSDIPTGMRPNAGYEPGRWEIVPNINPGGVTSDITYTFIMVLLNSTTLN